MQIYSNIFYLYNVARFTAKNMNINLFPKGLNEVIKFRFTAVAQIVLHTVHELPNLQNYAHRSNYSNVQTARTRRLCKKIPVKSGGLKKVVRNKIIYLLIYCRQC